MRGAPDPLLLPHGERRAADGRGQREVAVGAAGVGRHGAPRQRLGAGVERVALAGSSRCRGSARPRRAGRWRRASWPRSRWSRARARPRSARGRCAGRAPGPRLRPCSTWSCTPCASAAADRRAPSSDPTEQGEDATWTLTGPGEGGRMVIPALIEHKRDGGALAPGPVGRADPRRTPPARCRTTRCPRC